MSQVMRGNFEPKKKVSGSDAKEDLNTRFEREALKRLGGSIAFVSKKKFLFGVEKDAAEKDAATKEAAVGRAAAPEKDTAKPDAR